MRGVPLPVAVQRDDVARPVLARERVAHPQGDAVAAVALEADDERAGGLGDRAGAVRAAVVDDDRVDRLPARPGGDAGG